MLSRQTKKIYKAMSLLTLLAFIVTNAVYASIGSGNLRAPMHFAKMQKAKERVISRDANPILHLLGRRGDRGNVAIDDHTIVISMGGGDGNGLNTFIARTAKKAHARGERVVVVLHGLKGLLAKNYGNSFYEITPELAEEMDGLPSIASGSSRKKIDPKKEEDMANIERIIEIIKPARKVIFIGGNDHLRLTKIVADRIRQLNSEGLDIKTKIIGVSKSIDNDFRNRMFGYWTAVSAGRRIAKRASVPESGIQTRVFESFGRGCGSLNLEISKACPYSKAVLNPERKVSIQGIIDAWNQGVRNFFVSEGFSLSEEDSQLDELLAHNQVLRTMWDRAHNSPERDDWGNPRLTGASLYVVGIIEHFCKAKAERTDLTYQLRGAFSEKDASGRDFEEFLAEGFSEIAVREEASGLAVVYGGNYGEYDASGFGAKPAEEVYETINLNNVMTEEEMARYGVLGTKGVAFRADPAIIPEEDMALERAMMKAFFADVVSTAAHTSASVMEFRQPSEAIVSACGKLQPSETAKLPYDLGTVIDGTQDSVLILIPERQVGFYEIAKRIKEAINAAGYINIAVSKDFALDPEDFLLNEVISHNTVLAFKFLKAKKEAQARGDYLVTFDSGVSQFILELFKYLKDVDKKEFSDRVPVAEYDNLRSLKISFDSPRAADMGYAFEGLKSEGYPKGLLDDDGLLAERGVIGADLGRLQQRRAIESGA